MTTCMLVLCPYVFSNELIVSSSDDDHTHNVYECIIWGLFASFAAAYLLFYLVQKYHVAPMNDDGFDLRIRVPEALPGLPEEVDIQLRSLPKLPLIVLGYNIDYNHTDFFFNHFEEKEYMNRLESFRHQGVEYYSLNLKGVPRPHWRRYALNSGGVVFMMYNVRRHENYGYYRDVLLDLTDGCTIGNRFPLAIVLNDAKTQPGEYSGGVYTASFFFDHKVKDGIMYSTIVDRLGFGNVKMFHTSEKHGGIGYHHVLQWINNRRRDQRN